MRASLSITILLVGLLFWASPEALFAQQGSIRFTTVTDSQNRVRNRAIRGLYQDVRGYIWFTTDWALYRHDGLNTVEVHLHETTTREERLFKPRSAAEDGHGRLYLSSADGLALVDEGHDRATLLRSDYFDQSTEIVFDAENHLWCTHDGNLQVFETARSHAPLFGITKKDLPGKAASLFRTAADEILLGVTGGHILRFDAEGREIGRLALNEIEPLPASIHTQIRARDATSVWVLIGGRCFVIDLETFSGRRIEMPAEIGRDARAILLDQGGRTWVGTTKGLYCLCDGGISLYQRDEQDPYSLPSSGITFLHQDRSGVIWSATTRGLSRFDGRWPRFEFRSIPVPDSRSGVDVTRCTIRDRKGRTWLGGPTSGLAVFTGLGLEHRVISLPSSRTNHHGTIVASMIELESGKVLVGGSAAEFFIIEPESGEVERRFLPDPVEELELCRDLVRARDGRIWLGTAHRLIELDREGRFTGREHELPYRGTTKTRLIPGSLRLFSDGRIFGVTNPDYLVVLSEDGRNLSSIDLRGKRRVSSVFSAEEMNSGEIAIGSSQGLLAYNPIDESVRPLLTDTGWNRAYINSTSKDDQGRLWITGRNFGLAAVSADGQEILREFRSENGLYSEKFFLGASWNSADRRLLAFGTAEGSLYFRPDDILIEGKGPRVDITHVSIPSAKGPKHWSWSEGAILELDHDESSILIDFVAMDFVAPSANTFQYRVKEDEGPFLESRRHNSAVFGNLSPGRHTIQIRAQNADGFWSEKPTEVIIEVRPPFWMTAWFRFLMLMTGLAIVLGFIQWRTQNVRRRNRSLEAEVARRRETEKALLESQARVKAILDTAPYDFWLLDPDRVFQHQNPPSIRHHGLWIGRQLDEIAIDAVMRQRWLEQVEAALDGRQTRVEAQQFVGRTKRDVIELVSPLVVDERVEGVFGLTLDISDLRRAQRETQNLESQLLRAQKIEALGLLAGGVAHDFNNILTGIKGSAELGLRALEQEVIPFDTLKKDLEVIRSCSKRATDITGQLLSFSKEDRGGTGLVDLRDVMKRLQSFISPLLGLNVRLVVSVAPGTFPVELDGLRLEQVFLNLLLNASKAMPGGGDIVIAIENESGGDANGSEIEVAKPRVLIRVHDEGHGMPPEVLERIFEPFFTTSEEGKGTGLGLATCRRIIEDFGGHISAQSKPDEGTEFRILLPAVDAYAQDSSLVRAVISLREASVSSLVQAVLEQQGYAIASHFGPDAALEALADGEEDLHILVGDRRFLLPPMSRLLAQVLVNRPETIILVLLTDDEDVPENGHLDPETYHIIRAPFERRKLLMILRGADALEA